MLQIRLPVPRFVSASEIFCEKGSIGVLRALGASRIAVLVSRSLFKNEEAKAMILKAIGPQDHRIFERQGGEPHLENLKGTLAEIEEFGPDWIVAIGGGSVIDEAKILWSFYEHPDLDLDRATRPFGLPALRGKARFVAIPTTAGTGSEVSSSAVFIDSTQMAKKFLVSHELLPDLVVLDPALASFTPARISAIAGLDALTHAIEGYVSKFHHPMLDMQAEKAAEIVLRDLVPSLESPKDLALRMNLMTAATMAGWVQNLKLPGVAHAIAHQFGSFGVPHGLACGLLLGPSIRLNSAVEATKAKYQKLATCLGFKDPEALAAHCDHLLRVTGLETKIGQVAKGGASAVLEKKDEIVDGALKDPCARSNPRALDPELVFSTLSSVL